MACSLCLERNSLQVPNILCCIYIYCMGTYWQKCLTNLIQPYEHSGCITRIEKKYYVYICKIFSMQPAVLGFSVKCSTYLFTVCRNIDCYIIISLVVDTTFYTILIRLSSIIVISTFHQHFRKTYDNLEGGLGQVSRCSKLLI